MSFEFSGNILEEGWEMSGDGFLKGDCPELLGSSCLTNLLFKRFEEGWTLELLILMQTSSSELFGSTDLQGFTDTFICSPVKGIREESWLHLSV